MPCYTVVTISVKFKAENIDYLEKALEELGWRYQKDGSVIIIGDMVIDLEKEKADIRKYRGQGQLNELKRKYSAVAIEDVAKKKRWILSKKTENKFTAKKY